MFLSMHYSSHMNFGSQTLAEEIADLNYSACNLGEWSGLDNSKEWEFVGSGSYRNAYLHKPTAVVYKVEQDWDPAEIKGMDNVTEAATALRLRALVWEAVYIPRTALFSTERGSVLAMEYIKGERHGYGTVRGQVKGRMELFIKGQLGDMHTGNYFVVGDVIVPIDLASDSRRPDHRLICDIED